MSASSSGGVQVFYTIERDSQTGSAYIYLPEHPRTWRCVKRTLIPMGGLQLDLDASNRLIGIEVFSGERQPASDGLIDLVAGVLAMKDDKIAPRFHHTAEAVAVLEALNDAGVLGVEEEQ